jgi:hypothetical protein
MPDPRHLVTPLKIGVALLALLALPACGSTDPASGITITTDKASYTTAEPVVVTLTNTTSSEVGYSSCPERWDHKVDTGYVRFEEFQECLVGSVPLPAGESATLSYTFPDGQPAGTWRIPIPITSDDGDKVGEARSKDFEVGG